MARGKEMQLNDDELEKHLHIQSEYIRNKNTFFCNLKDIMIGDVVLDVDVYLPTLGVNLQRAFVWTQFQQEQFILSLLKGIDIPPYTIIHDRERQGKDNGPQYFEVIDGKQRLCSAIAYADNKFSIEVAGVRYFFRDLSKERQRQLLTTGLCANIAYNYKHTPISDAQKVEWFNFINFAGTPADLEHKRSLEKVLSKNR